MWISKLFWKLFLVYAGLNLVPALVFLILASRWNQSEHFQRVENQLKATSIVLSSHLRGSVGVDSDDQVRSLVEELNSQLDKDAETRITVVASNGVVMADSETDWRTMDNHANRPEIIQAIRDGYGTAIRFSDTVQMEMLYVAMPIENDREILAIIRMSMPFETLSEHAAALKSVLWIAGTTIGVIALALTFVVVRQIILPLSELTNAARAIASGNYSVPIRVARGDELGVLAEAFRNMAEQLAGQVNQLRDNSQRLETVLSSMVEGVLAVDAQQQVLVANEASLAMLDVKTTQIVGRPLLEIARIRKMHETTINSATRNKPIECEFKTIGQNARMLSMRATPLPGNPCSGVVIVLHDITDLRRLENLRREFVANVSHELKTPLSSIKAYAETLLMGAVNDSRHNVQFVKQIEEQADRLHQLIMDLLHLARIESGKEAFDIRRVCLDDVVRNCRQGYFDMAEAKGLNLVIEGPDTEVFVEADDDGLQTILDNLVGNAFQYTPEHGQISIHWRRHGKFAQLEVADTGIGITPADQQRVFERFYRVDKARSRELGGTGLGLAIVKHLTQAFNGRVEVESEVGQGSTFRLFIPLAADATDDTA